MVRDDVGRVEQAGRRARLAVIPGLADNRCHQVLIASLGEARAARRAGRNVAQTAQSSSSTKATTT